VIVVGTFLLLARHCLREGGVPWVVCVVCVWAAWSMRLRLLTRPTLFMFSFVALYLVVLRGRASRVGTALLPAVMVVWANVHPGFVVGLLLLWLRVVAAIVDRCAGGRESSWRTFVAVAVLASAAALVGPNGIRDYVPIWMAERNPYFSQSIFEQRPIPFHSTFLGYWTLLLATAAALILTRREVTWFDCMTAALFGVMPLYAARHMGLFAVLATPVLSKHLRLVFERYARRERLAASFAMRVGAIVVSGVVACLAIATDWRVQPGWGLAARRFPEKAADFILRSGLKGRMFNEWAWGGYLMFRLWPQHRVFLDGRQPLHGVGPYRDYDAVMAGGPRAAVMLERYGFDFAVVNYNGTAPFQSSVWRAVYWDDVGVVYAKANSLNRDVVQKWACEETNPVALARSIRRGADLDALRARLKRKLQRDPQCAAAYFFLGECWRVQGEWKKAVRNYRQAIHLDPTSSVTYDRLSECYERLGQKVAAKRAAQLAVRQAARGM